MKGHWNNIVKKCGERYGMLIFTCVGALQNGSDEAGSSRCLPQHRAIKFLINQLCLSMNLMQRVDVSSSLVNVFRQFADSSPVTSFS